MQHAASAFRAAQFGSGFSEIRALDLLPFSSSSDLASCTV
jgi:hypothetical protein